jgi:xanthine dehydrogenase small subunit
MLRFELNGRPVEVADASPNLTLLQWLRGERLTGTKEGCAEGDCGACTVVLLDDRAPGGPRYRSVNSCLLLLPMVHGRALWTVEGIGTVAAPHPVQAAMVDVMGSQCGYCTPGFVMSLFEATYRDDLDEDWKIDDQLCGNLCRCTGYRPIRDAAHALGGSRPDDPFLAALRAAPTAAAPLDHAVDGERFVAPTSLAAITRLLAETPDARLICGATDLGLDVTKKHVRFPLLLSTEHVAELQGIWESPAGFDLGAAVTLTDLEDWSAKGLPMLHRMLRYFGARQIKHRATLGGNLCNASPIGDLAPVLLALDAEMVLARQGSSRVVPIAAFYRAYRSTALAEGELLVRVRIPRPSPSARMGAYKVSRRRELDISAVAAGMLVEVDDAGVVTAARLGFGGMAATPKRAEATEASLVGQPWGEAAAQAAAARLAEDFSPMDDHRGTAWFRATVARNLLLGFAAETALRAFVSLPSRHTGTVLAEEGR